MDAFAHFLPPDLRDALEESCDISRPALQNWKGSRALSDIHYRIHLLDQEGIDKQVITTPTPSLESVFSRAEATRLARIANDSLGETVEEYPDRLLGVATVSLLSVTQAIEELERAIVHVGLAGVLVNTNVNGSPVDTAEMNDFFQAVEDLDASIWLHPDRWPNRPDYPTETESKYDLHLMFGLPYDTTIAMSRLVLSGLFDRNPNLRILSHHAGGMIPFFAARTALHYGDQATVDRLGPQVKNFEDGMKSFFVDTMTSGSASALRTAYEFFGAEKMMFASDMPFGPSEGRVFVRRCREALEAVEMPSSEKRLIRSENALRFVTRSVEGSHEFLSQKE